MFYQDVVSAHEVRDRPAVDRTPEGYNFIPENMWSLNSLDIKPEAYIRSTNVKNISKLWQSIFIFEDWDQFDQGLMIEQLDSGERDFKLS